MGDGAALGEGVLTGNPARPDAERDMCISLRGSPDTKPALGRDTRQMPQVAGGMTVGPQPPDSSMPNRAFRPWLGATPRFRCPVRASARVGTGKPVPPSRGSLPVQQSHAGRPSPDRFRQHLIAVLDTFVRARSESAWEVEFWAGRDFAVARSPARVSEERPARGGRYPRRRDARSCADGATAARLHPPCRRRVRR